MHRKSLTAALFLVVAAVFLGGCATPIDKSEITPKLYAPAEKNIALSVVEQRPYVLTGGKPVKFEGHIRGGFGIPVVVLRPGRPDGERFVDYLAEMVKDGFAQSGINVSVVPMPNGTSTEDAFRKLADTGALRQVVIQVHESNWDAGGLSGMLSYKYNFGTFVSRPGGSPQGKHFAANEANKASDKYNVFDMHSLRYREIIETMFNDPAIKQGLQ